jgi:hypothetical protein
MMYISTTLYIPYYSFQSAPHTTLKGTRHFEFSLVLHDRIKKHLLKVSGPNRKKDLQIIFILKASTMLLAISLIRSNPDHIRLGDPDPTILDWEIQIQRYSP